MEHTGFLKRPVKRRHQRVQFEALAQLRSGDRVITAVIEDLSAGGARIRLGDEAASEFFGDGWVLSSPIIGSFPVEIRWRQVDAAGVRFDVTRPQQRQIERLVGTIIETGLRAGSFRAMAVGA